MAISVNEPLTSRNKNRGQPILRFKPKYNDNVYLSTITLQFDARFSAYGALEIRANDQLLLKQATGGSFSQYKNYALEITNTVLNQGEYLEVYLWNPKTDDPVGISLSFSYDLDPLQAGDIAESRSVSESNKELSESVGGIDEPTKALLAKLSEIKSNIGARALTIDTAALSDKITLVINAINNDEPRLAILQGIHEIFEVVGGQDITNDPTRITAQLQGLLEALQATDLEVDTGKLETLIKTLTSKTIPDDLGISDVLAAVAAPPDLEPEANAAILAIRTAIVDLLNGFDLYELQRSINVLDTNIEVLERRAPGLSLTDDFRLLRLRLKRQHETVPSLREAESSALFPRQLYLPGTSHTNVIDSKGHDNFVASMTSDKLETEVNKIGDHDPFIVNPKTAESSKSFIYDFKDTLTLKQPTFQIISSGSSDGPELDFQIRIHASNTADFAESIYLWGIGNTSRFRNGYWTMPKAGNPSSYTLPISGRVYRYLRITLSTSRTHISGRAFAASYEIINVKDSLVEGGKGFLSFELKDEFENWYPVILASELGSITDGGTPVIIRFNQDTFGFPLPASKTIFRARLDIEGGALKLGVSLTLLS